MKNLINKIIVQSLLFITAIIFSYKFIDLDIVILTNPFVSIITWTLLSMIFVFDFDPIFNIKEKWLVPLIKVGLFSIIAWAMWRTGNTNDIVVALSLMATSILAVFIITLFFDGDDVNFVDKISRYVAVLAGALLIFDLIVTHVFLFEIYNSNMIYFSMIILSQVVNRVNIEYLVFKLSRDEECKTHFSERKKVIKFSVEVVVQSAFYISMLLLLTKTIETQLFELFPEFSKYQLLLCVLIVTSIIATHSIEVKKHLMLTIFSNIKWAAKSSIRMLMLFFTILLLQEFKFEYLIIIGFIFVIVLMFEKFISTNLMSKKSFKFPAYIFTSFIYYSAFGYMDGTPFNFTYSDLRINLNISLSLLFILYLLHNVFGIKDKKKIIRLEAIGVIAAITVTLSIIANTIIFGFAISISGAFSSIGVDDFGTSTIKFIDIILLSGSAILAYIPVSTKNKVSTITFSAVKWLGIFYIFNFIISVVTNLSNGLLLEDYVTLAATVVSIVIARGISEKRIKFGWVILFGLTLVFTIEFVYMAVNWMRLFDLNNINFNGFRILYATYFLVTAFAYVYIRNMRIGKSSRVYSGVRFITSAVISSVLFIALVWGKPAPTIFDLNKIDDQILEKVIVELMEEFPSVDWCEILDDTGIGDEIGIDCGNYVILPEEESYLNSFRDGVATEYDPISGEWNIESSYGTTASSSGTDHSIHTSTDYQSMMDDPAVLSSWFTEKSDYDVKLEIPFGATRNTIPTPMFADLLSSSEDIDITSDDANILSVSKLVKMEYTINYRMINEVGLENFVNLMNGDVGSTSSITNGYIEVPGSMSGVINDLVSEFQSLSVGQVTGDYNTINSISAFISSKYDIISGLPQNPAAMTITDLVEFNWHEDTLIEEQMETGTLSYSAAVSLQSLMAARLNIKTRIANQLVPMTSEENIPGLFPLGVPKLEVAVKTPSGGVWTDIQVATPVPSNNSGVMVTGLDAGDDIFLRRNIVDLVGDEATFKVHEPNDFSPSSGFIYGENPYGDANVDTTLTTFNVTYNPLFTSPQELFTYGAYQYNGSSNGIEISDKFGTAQQGLNIGSTQVHSALLPDMKLTDTLKKISMNDYSSSRVSDGSGTTIENSDAVNIARLIEASNTIHDDDDPTVMQIITQARININNYIDNVLNNDLVLKEKYTANKQAFIDSIFVEYNRLLGIDLRIVTGYTANQTADDILDANPSHMFELYVDDVDENWIPLPDYLQASKQVIASRQAQDGTSNIDSIFDVIQDEVGSNEEFEDFDYIGKSFGNDELVNSQYNSRDVSIDLGTEYDISTNSDTAITDPIFNDAVYGIRYTVLDGRELLSNMTTTTFTKVAPGNVEIEIYYMIPSTGQVVSQEFTFIDSGFIPVIFEGLDVDSMDIDQIRNEVGNIYSVDRVDDTYTISAYEDTIINYCEFIEMIHFVGGVNPSQPSNASNLNGINQCSVEAEDSTYRGIYSGTVSGIDYNDLLIDFYITTVVIDSDLGNQSNSGIPLTVYEGEKFDMREFIEHDELAGVEVGRIWVNGIELGSNDQHLFVMSSNSSQEDVDVEFEVLGTPSNGGNVSIGTMEMSLREAQIVINSTRNLDDLINGDSLNTSLSDYVTVTEPNSPLSYTNSTGELVSSIGSNSIPAPWFMNQDRHNNNYDLSMISSLEGLIGSSQVTDAMTQNQELIFSRGLWQNKTLSDLNPYIPSVDIDLNVVLSYSYETTFSYSIDGVDFTRTNTTASDSNFIVVDDKLILTVNETNRTPNELTSISDSGWVFRNKLGEVVPFSVQRLTSNNTAYHSNGEFYFGELSADFTQGHDFRIYATSQYSNIDTEDIVKFVVSLNEFDIDFNDVILDYYANYFYDISTLISITDWNGDLVTNSSNITWSVEGGSTFNPATYTPIVGITDFKVTITYAQRSKDYFFSLNVIDKVTEDILPTVTPSEQLEVVTGDGASQTYNYTYLEEDVVYSPTGTIDVCELLSVQDVVDNSSLGIILIDPAGDGLDCKINIWDSLNETMQITLQYTQRYGPDQLVTLNVKRTKSTFEVVTLPTLNTVWVGRRVAVDLTLYKTENETNYFMDNFNKKVSFPIDNRNYQVGETVKFVFDVGSLFELSIAGDEEDFINVDIEYNEVSIDTLDEWRHLFNYSEFSLEKKGGVWFILGTDIEFEQFNDDNFDGRFTPYENQTYYVSWINDGEEIYIVEMSQTEPPSMIIFYILISLMLTGIGGIIFWKWKTKPAKPIVKTLVKTKDELKAKAITKAEEIIIIHDLIMNRIKHLFEKAAEKSNVIHKGNMTWREYSKEISSNLEQANLEEWDALTDVLERCSYYRDSLEWIHFNYVERIYQETYTKLEQDDKVKTKKY